MNRIVYRLLLVALCAWTASVSAEYYPNMIYGPKRVLAPGLTWQTATHGNPAWSIQIFEIDMEERNIELHPVFKAAGNVSGSANERTSSIAARVDGVAAINAGYFTTDGTRLTNSYTMIDGRFIGGSGASMHPENNRSALGFSGGRQEIPKRTKLNNTFDPTDSINWEKIIDAIAGRGHFVTANGQLIVQDNEGTTSSHNGNRHDRTAIGYSLQPYRAWLVTVDGRRTGFSVGMTYTELGRLMADLGIEQSISLDGGGSTTAWVKGKGVVNWPSDGSERGVVSAWVAVPAITMDNTTEEVSRSDNWNTEANHPEQYNLNHFVTHSSAGPASITWTPDLARNGLYRVYAWWASDSNRATAAPYQIVHHFGVSTAPVNQTERGGQWNRLGTFPFSAGTGGSVTLENSSIGTLSGDAVRFVFVRDEPRLFWESKAWRTIALDDFDLEDPIAFDPLVRRPGDSVTDNSRWQRNFNYSTLSNPVIPVPAKGNGVALRTSANNQLPAAEQILYQTFGDGAMEDSAVEALLLGYLADNNTAGSTTWGGIGIRMSDDLRNGYFAQHRVDDGGSFGSYLSFYRIKEGNPELLGRYYYRVGTGGVVHGTIGDSRAIWSPQRAATNQWVPVRLEAVENTVSLFIDNMEVPVAIYPDLDPILTGKAALFHEDPFGGSLTTPSDSSGIFFESFQVDVLADPEVPTERTPEIVDLEFLAGGGVRVQFLATAGATYVVEASSDLVGWTAIQGAHTADAEEKITVEDEAAQERRFWRLRRVE